MRGSRYDTNTAETIRTNLSHIEWAEQNIIGGAKNCKSMAHIIRQKKGNNPTEKAEPEFVAEKEAMKYSIKQLEAMLAYRKKRIGKLGK